MNSYPKNDLIPTALITAPDGFEWAGEPRQIEVGEWFAARDARGSWVAEQWLRDKGTLKYFPLRKLKPAKLAVMLPREVVEAWASGNFHSDTFKGITEACKAALRTRSGGR